MEETQQNRATGETRLVDESDEGDVKVYVTEGQHKVRALDAAWQFLEGHGRNVYSQAGEDGVIRAVFERIGITNKCCFEVGAHDGKFLSNTMQWRNEGWRAVLIEPDPAQFEKLREFQSETVQCWQREIGEGNNFVGRVRTLDDILWASGCNWSGQETADACLYLPKDLDLGVIDIDNQDYYAWLDMTLYRPRVLMIEVSCTEPSQPIMYIPARGEKAPPGGKQATEDAIIELGEAKNYQAVARVGVNVVFVAREAM